MAQLRVGKFEQEPAATNQYRRRSVCAKGSHSLKVGVDFRRLSPLYDPASVWQLAYFVTCHLRKPVTLDF